MATLLSDEKTVKKLQGQINQLEDKINLSKGLKASTTVRSLKGQGAAV